ncbi:MAG: DNA-protecting protein DprA [Nevskia sp.]|nr:DNA-protecting protein DprA [Nevskia sp.]
MVAQALRGWLALQRTSGLGGARAQRLLERWGEPESVLAAGVSAWRAEGLSEALCEALARPDWDGVERDLAWLAAAATAPRAVITRRDPRYPPLLAQVAQAPLLLFAIGDAELLRLPQLAMVGARSASAQGLENAQAFAAELARRGLTITSGLALGIDAAAHRGALAAEGFTVAVCGNGLDRIYPSRNRELAHAIAARGLLLSEFPIGVPPLPEHFPRRNRIISGLALGTLVVEAARESGSLITARLAAEQGREVFAIPGSIHNPLARGCHALIREGAKLVETVDDILAELAAQLPAARAAMAAGTEAAAGTPGGAAVSDPDQVRVLEALGFETLALDHLVGRLGLPVERIAAALLGLELAGQVAAGPGDTFTRLQRA